MAETKNTAEVASKISKDIFRAFHWTSHPKHDDNFLCVHDHHTSEKGKQKKTHPGDVVFRYEDPYLGKAIYLHTDLKSYAEASIKVTGVRAALKSLAYTIECAQASDEWRTKYSIEAAHEVRGLLFVHNHDGKDKNLFRELVERVGTHSLPIAPGMIIHFLGPDDINRLYNIANDIIRLKHDGDLPADYTFYHPDLVLKRRIGDVWGQAATIEGMTGPFLIIRHKESSNFGTGYLIYYNRPGAEVEEFEYLIDCMSRFQMIESGQVIRIRSAFAEPHRDMKSIFHKAVNKYAKAWGFEPERTELLNNIDIDRIISVTSQYNPGDLGWHK